MITTQTEYSKFNAGRLGQSKYKNGNGYGSYRFHIPRVTNFPANWSSTKYNTNNGWNVNVNSGNRNWNNNNKNNNYRVRLVRAQ